MASVLNCVEGLKKRPLHCIYCEGDIDGTINWALVLKIQNEQGFDTMLVRNFCSEKCRELYRKRIKEQLRESDMFGLSEFETVMRRDK
jgi:hypothetical protein